MVNHLRTVASSRQSFSKTYGRVNFKVKPMEQAVRLVKFNKDTGIGCKILFITNLLTLYFTRNKLMTMGLETVCFVRID